jgi:hypothetical protein
MSVVKPILITYPRSASHYFDKLFYAKTNFYIERCHTVDGIFNKENDKLRKVITIVRDPRDSINSYISLKAHFKTDPENVREMVSEYILLYSFLNDHADYVIDYKDLVEQPEVVIDKLVNLMGITKENYVSFANNLISYDSKNFISSSKDVPGYGKVNLDYYNVNSCYFYYNRLLSKKITI